MNKILGVSFILSAWVMFVIKLWALSQKYAESFLNFGENFAKIGEMGFERDLYKNKESSDVRRSRVVIHEEIWRKTLTC